MTSVKVKFTPSSVILKEGSVHYQIIHHCKVRHIRTGYKLFPSEW
ncbi:site-specific integrase, partial [Parabacteroides merdae]|nr:site-specific integrase [Parabacteroides merdae]MTU75705.1 site-specific integrase [Parabacteroides merdae]MTU82787.1 site-specific integrase [Parabacteroides merdae]MTU86283.1 site-specific integrase [Parabacteroides merdae]MTU95637.1 site-specific integrase [Parabacteroides merdae]